MSLLFFRRTRDTGIYRPDGKAQTTDHVVDEDHPLPVRLYHKDTDEDERAEVHIANRVAIAGEQITRMVQVPGIGTASAYADGEAFGGLITWHDVFRPEKCSGTIVKVLLYDLDDEGIQIDMPLFTRAITATTDNNAFAVIDTDLLYCVGVVSVVSFYNWNVNQIGQATPSLWVQAETPNLYTQLVARGAPNIAAGAIPWISITVVPD